MHRRAGRAFGALSVVAFAAFGPTGPALAVGTVAQTEPVSSLSVTPFGPYAAAEVAGPTAVAAATPTLPMATATSTPGAPPPPPRSSRRRPPTAPASRARCSPPTRPRAASNPSCHLPWTLLAGIGRVESGNAAGGRVDAAGTTHGRILGPRLDGATSRRRHDPRHRRRRLDGDTAFDRAVGPMQFIPSTWKTFAKDGNNDGVVSPHNVFDAAVAAANYLCAGGGDLSQPAAQRAALLRYNRSDAYGALVLRWAAAYGAGVSVIPDGTGPVPSTLPTPPAQVPAPANGALDPAAAAALAAPAPAVSRSGRVRVGRGHGRDDHGDRDDPHVDQHDHRRRRARPRRRRARLRHPSRPRPRRRRPPRRLLQRRAPRPARRPRPPRRRPDEHQGRRAGGHVVEQRDEHHRSSTTESSTTESS